MSEKTKELTASFEGPLSFSSMAAQVFLYYGFHHAGRGEGDFSVIISGEAGNYTAAIEENGRRLFERKNCAGRREAEKALMDGFSAITGKPLGKWGYLLGMRPEKALYPFFRKPGWEEEAKRFLAEEKVSPEMAQLLMETARCHKAVLDASPFAEEKTASLYLHVPFCPSHCVYCSFPAAIAPPAAALASYAEALARDAEEAAALAERKGLYIESVYMGGGTPSILSPSQMDQVLHRLDPLMQQKALIECTVEAGRPDTIGEELLSVLSAHGVSRISINPQTMQDRILRQISRSHSEEDIFRAMEAVRRYGFSSVNMDFICGLPSQTLSDMKENLDAVCQLCPENVTIHTLAVKRGSPFFGHAASFHLPREETVAAMLAMAEERLRRAGYHPYYLYRQKYMTDDFANVGYARKGHDSVYNIQMIGERQHVIGAGAGAVSKAVLPGGFRLRKLYMPRNPAVYEERLTRLLLERCRLWDWMDPDKEHSTESK